MSPDDMPTGDPNTAASEMVRRYRCPHCRRSWSSKQRANEHASTCFYNPNTRSCPTCTHHVRGFPASYEDPGEEEHCEQFDALPPDFPLVDRHGDELDLQAVDWFPQRNCPLWQPGAWLGSFYGEGDGYSEADFPLPTSEVAR